MRYYIVDVFAERKYAGNQLAVVPDAGDLSDAAMQEIAREMHLSETAFVRSGGGDDNAYDVRIFTPEHEVPFAADIRRSARHT
jgi:trans-2,3-dihydro-3-hydroxyanthranilate isomerase